MVSGEASRAVAGVVPRGALRAPGASPLRRGALLLEAMLALAVFAMAGLAILGAMNRSSSALEAVGDARKAADLAASAMAEIEAGISRPETLHGQVPAWEPEGEGFADAPPAPSLWELEIETEASGFPGLTKVSVRALKRAAPGSDTVVASYALTQLVRLSAEEEDSVGETDVLAGGGR